MISLSHPPQSWFYLPAILSIAFLAGFYGVRRCYSKINDFRAHLKGSQLDLYDKITRERRQIFFSSLFQGLLFVLVYISFSFFYGGKDVYHFLTDIMCILLGSTYIFYIITPKTCSMLDDADLSNEDVRKWYDVYQCMEQSFWYSFLMGLVVGGLILHIIDVCVISSSYPPDIILVRAQSDQKKKKNKNKNINKKSGK